MAGLLQSNNFRSLTAKHFIFPIFFHFDYLINRTTAVKNKAYRSRKQFCHHYFFSSTACCSMGLVIQITAQLQLYLVKNTVKNIHYELGTPISLFYTTVRVCVISTCTRSLISAQLSY